ncbi:MAG: Smr/MutS family protein [Bryobacterales bacterium]|jgi:DNA mismatch repair protein MutS2|nr:Smr/MutS family protein [Bryobacterales bacterium]
MSIWSDALLEFDALKDILRRYVFSPTARREVEHLQPTTDLPALRESLADLAEAMDYQRQAVGSGEGGAGVFFRLKFSTLPDPSPSVGKLRVEGIALEAQEVLAIQRFLERAQSFRAQLQDAAHRFPRLSAKAEPLADFRPLLKKIEGKVLPDGSISDDASPFLRRVRKDIEKQRRDLEATLDRFLRKFRDEGVLQEDFVTQRNERYVLPIVATSKGRVDGIVHGASGSGQTLYLEPLEVLGMNNDLVRLQNDELEEIRRILAEITHALRGHYHDIRLAAEVVTSLELLFGKADFADAFDCTVPTLSDARPRRLFIDKARHPLLQDVLRKQAKQVVPVTLELTEAQRTLLISGPNTGGKTVALKTVGLLVLMAQAGLAVPCREAVFPVFHEVLADIGDNQSILESLSTFSSHVLRLKDMMQQVTMDSLVILDEIGRATDPEEGGALAVAVTDTFRERGAFTLVSTHLMPMKVYGANRDEVLNGSMGFNEATLEPTYQLRLGAPGKSAGLDIAKRLGIPQPILEKARATISRKEEDLAKLIATLNARLEEVAEKEARIQSRLDKLKRRDDKLSLVWKRRESEKLRELEARHAEVLARFEKESKAVLERMAETTESKRAVHHAQVTIAKARREVREDLQQVITRVQQGEPEPPPAPQQKLEPGMRLKLRDIREPATLLRLLDDERIEVQVGFMKLQLPRADIKELLGASEAQGKITLPKNVSFTLGPSAHVLQRELNIIGKTEEEGIDDTERFLDQAILAQVQMVRIVHGHGKGILKRAVHSVLSNNPNVAKFYPATQAEGGTGATIAELRED